MIHDELNRRDRLRDKEVLRLRKAGWTLTAIGNKYAISRQRVFQLLARLAKEGMVSDRAGAEPHGRGVLADNRTSGIEP